MTLVLIRDDDAPTIVERVPQGEARREHTLRDLIYDNPAILPVRDIDPGYGRLFTVARELNVPGVGFIDVLLADEHGRLVVVECKLWRNPQARREVVGQILDYARELSRYGYEDLQRQITIATRRQGNVLYALAREAGGVLEEAVFVDRVARDLEAGRFLLLIAGDGITEGTRRIGEYLRAQPGLAFEFALIEFAEYRASDEGGTTRTIIQPRILAQTVTIERHVIRSEVAGVSIDAIEPAPAARTRVTVSEPSDSSRSWQGFVDRFVAETVFDDPAQPPARRGGNGWIRVPLPDGLYVNLYRSSTNQRCGAHVRFASLDGAAWELCLADRDAIDAEFITAGLPAPDWGGGEVPGVGLVTPSTIPWDAAEEDRMLRWMGVAANQFVNSFRPRLQNLHD
ncbi:hypothetical protein GCM10008023_06730 [Sphingomonas glacialis]|uniref:DUF4268 domain-containing protein n=1 Tax=Sphingomonas glacialis TaxID=658225 RepID=A0ABQ3L9R6_9SPHN|nr:hypothetical protein [Sphingomonas glacialis]GHH09711.1 hypothetical protein GCM10008023_06730 [Sphingomonas glacialis]